MDPAGEDRHVLLGVVDDGRRGMLELVLDRRARVLFHRPPSRVCRASGAGRGSERPRMARGGPVAPIKTPAHLNGRPRRRSSSTDGRSCPGGIPPDSGGLRATRINGGRGTPAGIFPLPLAGRSRVGVKCGDRREPDSTLPDRDRPRCPISDRSEASATTWPASAPLRRRRPAL